jgi:8-oxo-dGTP pyrophosphatase MutT (NUDIX family)
MQFNKKRTPKQKTTLLFLIKGDRILLAMKKRGFGKGRYNGVGGKPEGKEKIEQTAKREAEEEIGIVPKSIQEVAKLNFYFPNQPDWDQQVITYLCTKWSGKPKETEEMRPKWFDKFDLPYKKMWPDDKLWLPHTIEGKYVKANFTFGEGDVIADYNIKVINKRYLTKNR